MGDFFRGWRRIVGCITLLIASMLSCVWMRSYFYGDVVKVGLHEIISQFGEVSIAKSPAQLLPSIYTSDLHKSEVFGREVLDPEHFQHHPSVIHFGIMAIPLTAMSLGLLVWPRRWRRS